MLPIQNRAIKRIMGLLRWESEDPELLQTIARRVILTTLTVVIVWHIIATLLWTQIFSPSMYAITALMILVSVASLLLQKKLYLLAQLVWYAGLSTAIVLAFQFYQRPEILFLFCFLPIMAEVMIGIKITFILDLTIALLVIFWNFIGLLPALPKGYEIVLLLATVVSTAIGWGVSYNLVLSVEMASHHYREARERLEEAREQRAEISVLLKDVNNANYQLDRMNTMLTEARTQADQAREERDRFALAVSHELRSPLNFIIGFSDLMVNSPATYGDLSSWPSGLYDDINEIYKSSRHLLQLINDILDMGKMDARQFTVFREKIDFRLIIEDVCGMVHSSIENKGLRLIVEVQPDIAPVFVDRTRIRQVLLNLVTNSLRFTHKGSITIRAYPFSPDLLRVEVIDTGTGIAKKDLDNVFRDFRQVGEPGQQSGEGSGLGLSIGRRFIKLHDGEMGVESEPGKGSLFFFTVPFHQKADDLNIIVGENVVEPVTVGLNDQIDKEPLILLISSDAFSAQLFIREIKGFKFTLLTIPSQLMSVAKNTYPRAVIIDERIAPNPIIQSFVNNPPYDVPILTFPIPIRRQSQNAALPQGVLDYLVKPVPRQVICDLVKNLELEIKTILVVDDDPSMSRFVIQALRSQLENETDIEEYKILTALDGQEALRFLHTLPVGAIFLDLELTDMHGLTLLQHIQQDKDLPPMPVIIISASDPPPAFNPSRQGVYQVLVNRPLETDEITGLISSTLNEIPPRFRKQIETRPDPDANKREDETGVN